MSASPHSIGASIVVQLVCRGWAGLLTLLLAPVYIHYLGTESYGVIGVYAMLQTLLTIFDFGFGIALSRELARLPATPEGARRARDWVRTIEVLAWFIAAVLAACLTALAPVIGADWLRPEALSVTELNAALQAAALSLAAQWPAAMYLNGLSGRHRQVEAGFAIAAGATLRGLGGAALIAFTNADLTEFFQFQAILALLYSIASRHLLQRAMPAYTHRARFDIRLVTSTWRFATGMLGVSLVSILTTQADKLLLSRLMPLDTFGVYAFAAIAAAGITMISTPVFGVLMPRFAKLGTNTEPATLHHLYHLAAQFLTVALLPAAFTIAAHAEIILSAWTGNAGLAASASTPFTLLVLGNAANGLMVVPYALTIALGLSGMALAISSGLLGLLIPAILLTTPTFGGTGAAGSWLLVNVLYIAIGSIALHRRVLIGDLRQWLLHDIGAPAIGAATVVLGSLWLIDDSDSGVPAVLLTWAVAQFVATLVSARVFAWLCARLVQHRTTNPIAPPPKNHKQEQDDRRSTAKPPTNP